MSLPQAHLRILGRVELVGPDGRPVRRLLAQPKRLALLIYLAAANPGAVHRRDSLLALFWPEVDARRARGALNRAVYFLRRTVGRDVVVTLGDDEVGVSATRLVCDVVQFEDALAAGAAERALEIYRGDLAPGFLLTGAPGFERWLDDERARLRGRAFDVAMGLARHEGDAGRLGTAEWWAHRATVLSPYDERAAGLRIRLLDRMGDRAGALRAYQELQRRLRADLEIEPSPETIALSDAVRARSASTDRPPEVAALPRPDLGKGSRAAEPARLPAVAASGGRPPVLAASLLSVLLLSLLAYRFLPSRTMVLTTAMATAVSSEPGIEFQPALSPDGRLIAFTTLGSGRSAIVVRSATGAPGSGESRPAASATESQMHPAWSPDGRSVRFASTTAAAANPSVFAWSEVSRVGGVGRPMSLPRTSEWVAWSRDGGQAAFTVHDSIFAYNVSTQTTRLLAVHGGGWDPHSLAWSPDGRWIAYVNGNPFWARGWNTSPSSIWLVATAGGVRVAVTDQDHLNVSPAWLDDRHLLFVSDRDGRREVYVVELRDKGPIGAPVKVPGGTDAHSISVSADGKRLAVAKFIARQNVWSYPVTNGRPLAAREGRPVTSGTQVVETHDVSPDGQWLVYSSDLHGDADLYLLRVAGGTPMPLVTGPTSAFYPVWSPDGREIAFSGGPDDDIWVVPVKGGAPAQLTSEPGFDEIPVWSPDGLSIAFRSNRTGRGEAWVVTREQIGSPWSPARQLTDSGCAFLVWARDGSGLICVTPNETVLTWVSLTGRVVSRRDLAADGLQNVGPPVLSADGRTLYLRATRSGQRGIWAWPLAGGSVRLVLPFADPSLVVQAYPGTINVTHDRLYLTVGEFESDIWVMDLEWQ